MAFGYGLSRNIDMSKMEPEIALVKGVPARNGERRSFVIDSAISSRSTEKGLPYTVLGSPGSSTSFAVLNPANQARSTLLKLLKMHLQYKNKYNIIHSLITRKTRAFYIDLVSVRCKKCFRVATIYRLTTAEIRCILAKHQDYP
jgi:hypothetical protein